MQQEWMVVGNSLFKQQESKRNFRHNSHYITGLLLLQLFMLLLSICSIFVQMFERDVKLCGYVLFSQNQM